MDKKKNYLQPAMKMTELQHKCKMLYGNGGVRGSRTDYGKANKSIDEGELDTQGRWKWE